MPPDVDPTHLQLQDQIRKLEESMKDRFHYTETLIRSEYKAGDAGVRHSIELLTTIVNRLEEGQKDQVNLLRQYQEDKKKVHDGMFQRLRDLEDATLTWDTKAKTLWALLGLSMGGGGATALITLFG